MEGMEYTRVCTVCYLEGEQIPSTGLVTWETECCVVAPNICGSSLWNLHHATLLMPRILMCLLGFLKICASLLY